MSRLEISDDAFHAQIKPSVVDTRLRREATTSGIKPRWWVRAMSIAADALWDCHLSRASWAVADLCVWLQKKIQPPKASN